MARNTENKAKSKPQPLVDKIMMGPLEKYVKFNKFPYKL